jgi:hypothetical protein
MRFDSDEPPSSDPKLKTAVCTHRVGEEHDPVITGPLVELHISRGRLNKRSGRTRRGMSTKRQNKTGLTSMSPAEVSALKSGAMDPSRRLTILFWERCLDGYNKGRFCPRRRDGRMYRMYLDVVDGSYTDSGCCRVPAWRSIP